MSARRQRLGFLLAASFLAISGGSPARAFPIFLEVPSWDWHQAVAFNSELGNYLVLAHEVDQLANRRVADSEVLVPRVVYAGEAQDYAVDYNEESESFLAAWSTASQIRAVRLNRWGQLLGSAFTVHSSPSKVAVTYIKGRNRWLVAWQGASLMARVVRANGSFDGPAFELGGDPVGLGKLAYSQITKKFLVVWGSQGQFFREDGSLAGSPLSIAPGGSEISVAFSPAANAWLVVWRECNAVRARFIKGGVPQTIFSIGGYSCNPDDLVSNPEVAFNGSNKKFLVAWSYFSILADNGAVEAQWVAAIGTLSGGRLDVASGWVDTGDGRFLDCSSSRPRCLVTWAVADFYGRSVYGSFVPEIRVLDVTYEGTGWGWVDTNPSPWGSCWGPGDECWQFEKGTVVTLVPHPDSGSELVGWGGDPDCADGVVTMSSDRSCTATFNVMPMLTVTKLGVGDGTVTSSPAGIDCGPQCQHRFSAGRSVRLTATPETGSQFSHWGGDPDCADGEVVMGSDRTCTATFDPCSIPSEVTVSHTIMEGDETHQACNRLVIGPSVVIKGSAQCAFRAGNEVVFVPPVEIEAGGEMTVVFGPPLP